MPDHFLKMICRLFAANYRLPRAPKVVTSQLRELALRILISRVGIKLVPYLTTISENKKDDPFLRGRAIDSLAWFTSNLPQIFDNLEDFKNMPLPIQRSIVDFVTRHGINEELLVAIANNDNISATVCLWLYPIETTIN